MRKLMLIIGICLLFLCGCSSERGSERSIQGTVLEVIAGEENQVQFLMESETTVMRLCVLMMKHWCIHGLMVWM